MSTLAELQALNSEVQGHITAKQFSHPSLKTTLKKAKVLLPPFRSLSTATLISRDRPSHTSNKPVQPY